MSSKQNVIKVNNLRVFPQISENHLEEKWMALEREVVAILDSTECHNSLEELYRTAEDLHSQGYFLLLYNLQLVLGDHLHKKLLFILAHQQSEFLHIFDRCWKEFRDHLKTIKNIFLCFDRSSKNFKYNTVQSIGLNLFTTLVVLNAPIKKRLLHDMLSNIDNHRNGQVVNMSLLYSITEMLNVLHIYEEFFQYDFLLRSETFYEQEGSKLIGIYEIPKYLNHVNRRINEEQQRVSSYLSKITETSLLNIVYKYMVELNSLKILEKGFDELINKTMYDELALMYRLFQCIADGPKHLTTYLKNYVVKKGVNITNEKNDKNMIQNLLDFKDALEKIVRIAFQNECAYFDCIKSAFNHFVNGSNNKVAQLLAKYLDNKLRCKNISDEELENVFDKTLKLFKHVQGKDVFEAFYKKYLAKRLLLGKSTSQDAENSMISKLKQECGDSFTSNIEGMFQDINLSKTINNSFRERWRSPKIVPYIGEFTVNVLTNSYWPNYPNYQVNLPVELINFQQTFQSFYLSNHSGRKLLWQPTLGHCLVRAVFDSGIKELQVSLFQALVLLMYNNNDQATFKDIQYSTNLDRTELMRTILSLTYGKTRILIKKTKGKEVEDGDVFVFNNNFTDKLFRVRVNQLQLQQSQEEEEATERHVLIDRQYQIDAAIVRIMKDKKALKHSVLIREVYNILDIPVNQTDLKKRIELLIEREYIERDKENKSNYLYVA